MSSITPVEISEQHGASEFRRAHLEGLLRSTARYMLRTEVHTFAFSVAANAILSFFPFLLLLLTLIRRVFHSQIMYSVVEDEASDSLAGYSASTIDRRFEDAASSFMVHCAM